MDWKLFVETDGGRHEGEAAQLERLGIRVVVHEYTYPGGRRYDLSVGNLGDVELAVRSVGIRLAGPDQTGNRDWRVFLDKGACGWCGVKGLGALEQDPRMQPVRAQRLSEDVPEEPPFHRSNLQSVIWDATSGETWLIGFLRQRHGANYVDVMPTAATDEIERMEAWQELDVHLAPGAQQWLDPLVLAVGDDPYVMLEQFGTEVMRHHGRAFNDPPVVGMMTWHCKSTNVDEQFVVDNARIIGELFGGYPQPLQNLMLIDHGWQENANWGDFTPDRVRFSRGMPWLVNELTKHGVELALWYTPFCITEDAPNHEALIPLQALDANGQAKSGEAHVWGHIPGHAVARRITYFNGEKAETQEMWRNKLAQMKAWGAVYWKLDFFALQADDSSRVPRSELYARTWRTFREAVGSDGHLAPCSCPTNMQLGYCDSVRIATDIGDSGSWPGKNAMEAYRFALSTVAALWYKNRKFWVNDADSLQVAKGCSLNEARVRATVVALSGGHFQVGGDLRLDQERIEMIRRLIPPYPHAARPLDLFENPFPEGYPTLWSLQLDTGFGPMTVLAVFNLSSKTREYTIRPGMLDIDPGSEFIALEWWQSRWLGRYEGEFTIDVPAEDVAIIHAQPTGDVPSIVSISHHITGGYIVENVEFNRQSGVLSGSVVTKPGITMVLFGYIPQGWKLSRTEAAYAKANDTGGFQCEIVTTSQRTQFDIEFVRS